MPNRAEAAEPPQASRQAVSRQAAASFFIIGRDVEGFWAAIDSAGREGGLFVTRDAAQKFVAARCGRGHGAARFSPLPLSLWAAQESDAPNHAKK